MTCGFKNIFCFLSLVVVSTSCLKNQETKIAESSSFSGEGGSRLDLPLGESVSLDSPLTPLVNAIRKQALADVRNRKAGTPITVATGNDSLPNSVKKAILNVLMAQAEPAGLPWPPSHRPCQIAPNLLTPAEILYALQRAVLGRVEDDEPPIDAGVRQSWRSLLGYDPDILGLIVSVEAWLQELEKNGIEQLPRKVRDSLGVRKIGPVNDYIVSNVLYRNAVYLSETDRNRFLAAVASHGQVRCFVTGQLHQMPLGSLQFFYKRDYGGQNFVDRILEKDVFESVRYVRVYFNPEYLADAVRYLNAQDSVDSLDLGDHQLILALRLPSQGLDLSQMCDFKIPKIDRLKEDVRKRIKHIQIHRDTLATNRSTALKLLARFGPDLTAKIYLETLKKYFPSVTEFSIKIEYPRNDSPFSDIFIAAFLKRIAASGAQKVRLVYDNLNINLIEIHIPDATTLKGVEHVELRMHGSTNPKSLNLTRLLSKLPTAKSLRISQPKGIDGSMADLTSIKSPMALKQLTINDCYSLSRPLRIALDPKIFPHLQRVTLSGCPRLVIENLPAKTEFLKYLSINELIEVAQKVGSDEAGSDAE